MRKYDFDTLQELVQEIESTSANQLWFPPLLKYAQSANAQTPEEDIYINLLKIFTGGDSSVEELENTFQKLLVSIFKTAYPLDSKRFQGFNKLVDSNKENENTAFQIPTDPILIDVILLPIELVLKDNTRVKYDINGVAVWLNNQSIDPVSKKEVKSVSFNEELFQTIKAWYVIKGLESQYQSIINGREIKDTKDSKRVIESINQRLNKKHVTQSSGDVTPPSNVRSHIIVVVKYFWPRNGSFSKKQIQPDLALTLYYEYAA